MKFRTWFKTCLVDLADKFEILPPSYPDRPRLAQMIVSRRGELDASPQGDLFAGATALDDRAR